MKIHTVLVSFMAVLALVSLTCQTALADTRSATVRVSCTILPMIEMSTPQISDPALQRSHEPQSLGKDFITTLSFRDNGSVKVYSLTAL